MNNNSQALLRYEKAALTALGKPLPTDTDLQQWAAAARRLSAALTQDRRKTLKKPSIFYGDEHTPAAAVLTHAVRTHALTHALLRAYPPPEGPTIELGAGWGPAAAAINRPCTLIDKDLGLKAEIKTLFAALDSPKPTLKRGDAANPGGKWSVIFAPFVLNELGAPEDAINNWLQALTPGGRLYILEPAIKTTARNLQNLRDGLAQRYRILGPCLHTQPCPATGENDWCHMKWTIERPPISRQVMEQAGLDPHTIRFSWLVVERAPPTETDQYRLLDTRREKKKLRIAVCGQGRLETLTILKRAQTDFETAKAAPPGTRIDLQDASVESKGDGLRVSKGARFMPLGAPTD